MASSGPTQSELFRLAEIHFVVEHSERFNRICEFDLVYKEIDVMPAKPDYKQQWLFLPANLREEYIEKAKMLWSEKMSDLDIKAFYKGFFGRIDPLVAQQTPRVAFSDFKEQATEWHKKQVSKPCMDLNMTEDPVTRAIGKQDPSVPTEMRPLQSEEPMQTQEGDIHRVFTIDELENTVQKGVKTLEILEKVFERYSDWDSNWKSEVAKTIKKAEKTKVIIGVIGSTGAGKSSVINALVDEERVVPTNCLRACTTVATEISYNYGDSRYRAKIEFVKRKDWERELRILFEDLKDNGGDILHDNVPKDSDAGMALDKIRAVYPYLSRKDVLDSSVEKLLQQPNVAEVLGTTFIFEEDDARVFYRKLKSYVDSKEKKRGKKKEPETYHNEFEWWPLIRVVRLYLKAAALSTGAVIVDLPGVHDSNAARVAVAEEYMKKCSAHWIVAPINRAVDDQVAKKLLGENLKRQLAMDGAFGDITFICSKTDDISPTEVQESLGLDFSFLWEQFEARAQERASLTKDINELQLLEGSLIDELGEVSDKILAWLDVLRTHHRGHEAYAPLENTSPLKRKREGDNSSLEPKKQAVDDSDDELAFSDECEETTEDSGIHDVDRDPPDALKPLTEEDINKRIEDLRGRNKELSHKRDALKQEIQARKELLTDLTLADNCTQGLINMECIRARNMYSKSAIQRDFALGIKELDQENSEEMDPANFDPTTQLRDYGMLERNLPVFCVSSRGYQKLSGRQRRDSMIPGFTNPEDTEIPKLQRHCRLLADAARESSCLNFLQSLDQIFQSLNLWSLRKEPTDILPERKRLEVESELNHQFNVLSDGLKGLMQGLFAEQADALRELIFDKLDRAVARGNAGATKVIKRWNAPLGQDGSNSNAYRWNTYKAICRREGVYKNQSGVHDWNQELCDPMLKRLLPEWQRAFSTKVPEQLRQAASNFASLIERFHENATNSASDIMSRRSKDILETQRENYCKSLEVFLNRAKSSFNEGQRTINRNFTPAIAEAMEAAYRECSEQRGIGVLSRMRGIIEREIDTTRHYMFRNAANSVKADLQELLKLVQDNIQANVQWVLNSILRDYYTVIVAPQLESFTEKQISLKDEVSKIINEAQAELRLEEKLPRQDKNAQPKKEHTGDVADRESTDTSLSSVPDDFPKEEDTISIKMEDATDGYT